MAYQKSCLLLVEDDVKAMIVDGILKAVKIHQYVEVQVIDSKSDILHYSLFSRFVHPYFFDYDNIAMLFDSDTLNIADSKSLIEEKLKSKKFLNSQIQHCSIFCAIPSIYAWLFADDELAKKYARNTKAINRIERLPLPELIPYPKQIANNVFKPYSYKNYTFLENIDIERAIARSSSLRDFITGISKLVGMIIPTSKDTLSKSINREIFTSLLFEVASSDKIMWKTVNNHSFTAKDLIKEVSDGSEVGKQYISEVLRVARDLIAINSNKK